jgi:dephospho-CoA kinase
MTENKLQKKAVLGLVGPICSGKETVGSYIKDNHDCKYHSLSDVIREELDSVGFKDPSRETLQAVGNILRKIFGPGVLATRIAEKARKLNTPLVVVGSIRNPEEAVNLKKALKNFILLRIEASRKIRFERMTHRGRIGDPKTWPEFLKAEKREFDHKKNKFQMHIGVTAKMADFAVENNGTFEDLFKKVDKIVKEATA